MHKPATPSPPARCPSWVHRVPHACLTNPHVLLLAHDLTISLPFKHLFPTHRPSKRRPLRPQSDFWSPRAPSLSLGKAVYLVPCSGAFSPLWMGHFLFSQGDPRGALILPSAQVPGLHPELSHWGCVCPGLLPGWQPQSQESCLLIPTNALPGPGLTQKPR